MAFFSSFLKSSYTKVLFVVIIGVVGITAGVKIGYAYFLEEKVITFAGPQAPPASSLSFSSGDLFPKENYITPTGDTGNFEQLLKGKMSIVFFIDLGCEPCTNLLALWKKEVRAELQKGVQEIACISNFNSQIPRHYAALFEGMTVVIYDDTLWTKKYKKAFSPIIIGVDMEGRVTYEQFGFEGFIEYPIVNRFCLGR